MYTVKSEADYEKWRRTVFTTAYIYAFVVLVAEMSLFFLSEPAGIMYFSVPVHLIRFLVLPSVVNFTAVSVIRAIVKRIRIDSERKNFLACIALYLVCAVSQLVHYNIVAMLSATIVSIFASVIFANRRTTLFVFSLSLLSLTAAAIIGWLEMLKYDIDFNAYRHFIEYCTALAVHICSYISARGIISYANEREKKIADGYRRQLELINQVKFDAKTGLLNRRVFMEKLDEAFAKCQYTKNIRVVLIEINDFDDIRESFGREATEAVVAETAALIKECFASDNCCAAKYDFDKFAVLIKNETNEQTETRTEHLRARLSLLEIEQLKSEFVSVIYAVAGYTNDTWTSSDMLTRCERMLEAQRAKREIEKLSI